MKLLYCKILVFGFVLSITVNIFGQSGERNIKGYILDASSGEALPYANVTVKGYKMGTSTNIDGYFILLDVPSLADTLEIFYIGYMNKAVDLAGKDLSRAIIVKMEQNLLETEAITVTAEEYQIWKEAEEVSQVTFSPKQISILPNLGEVDIFRSLQLLPGISGVSDGSSGLYVRGGTPDQNLILLDGMTVYHVDHFFGFFSAFNANAVKDVQVFKGGFPAKYGGRISSVVDLTGKSGNINKTKLGIGVNLLSANGLLEIPLFGKGSFIMSARRSYTDFIDSPLYSTFYDFIADEDNSQPRFGGGFGNRQVQQQEVRPTFYFYDMNAKLSYNPTRRDALALSFYAGRDNLDDTQELGGLGFRSGGAGSPADVFGTRINQKLSDWGNIGASFKWSRQWRERFSMSLLAAGSQYDSNYDQNRTFQSDSIGSGLNDSSRVFRGAGFASEEKNRIDDLTLRLDNEFHLSPAHRIEFGTWISQIATDYRATLNDTLNLFHREKTSFQSAIYVQDKWNVTEDLQLTLGLRAAYYDKADNYYLEPRASASYQLTSNIQLKGAWGRYNQFIHRITNEDVLEGSRDFWLIADDAFAPEFAEHYISGISYENKDYLFAIEGYYKDMDNLIEYTRRFKQRADFGQLFFFGSGISRGIEFLAQKKAGAFNGWASYTLGEVTYTFAHLNNGDPFPASHSRTHEFKTVGTYSMGKWNFAATWVFASGQPYTSPESQYYLDMLDGQQQGYIHVGQKNANLLPDYHRLDVSLSRSLYPTDGFGERIKNSWQAELGLSVFNVYNHDNVWYRKYDLDVSPIVVTDVKMLGITPTVYLKVNF